LVWTEAYNSGHDLKSTALGQALALDHLERLEIDKCSGLFALFVIDKEKIL